jgi:hypothetical protein
MFFFGNRNIDSTRPCTDPERSISGCGGQIADESRGLVEKLMTKLDVVRSEKYQASLLDA